MSKPKLRFPEFAGDWVQHILSDVIVDIADGPFGSNLKLEHYTDKKEARIIQLSNLSDYGWQEENTRYTTFEHAEAIKRCIVNEDELIMGKMMPAGMTIMRPTTDKMYVLSSDCVRIKLDKSTVTDGFFLYTTKSEEFLNQIRSSSQGSTRIRTSISKIKNMNLNIPSLPEQQKIASLFTELDNLIQSAEKELEGYRELKQGMLQKMFPKKGETVPEIRFPEFTGDWEQRKVLDLLELLTDYDANGSFADMAKNINTTDGDGYAWYVRITDLENPKPLSELKYVDESSYEFLKKTELHGGELLMAKRGNIGKVYIFEPRTKYATVAPNMYLLKLNNKVIPHFLYDYFVSEEGNKKLTRLNASSTMGALYKDDVKNIDVIMPSIEEQAMIGNFFQSIDHIITLHQRELDGYKELKKGLLQQMFC